MIENKPPGSNQSSPHFCAQSLQPQSHMNSSVTQANIIRVKGNSQKEETDFLATEEPLEIRLMFGKKEARKQQSVSVTMRTPGHDFDLAAGFLFTEGIIQSDDDIQSIRYCSDLNNNVIRVELEEDVSVNIIKLERNFYTTSSCGVCGKASIDAVRTVCRLQKQETEEAQFPAEVLITLPDVLRKTQSVFENTGGLHGCALFDRNGNLILSREDVGRHNAVDKLVGAAMQNGLFPLHNYLLLLSGRASFELVQKAAMAAIQMVAAVGAPSSLAVQMATEAGITLVGFLRNGGFNIYTNANRILVSNGITV